MTPEAGTLLLSPEPAPARNAGSLFERVPVGLYRTTPDGRILKANRALVELLGFPDLETLMRTDAASVYLNRVDRARWRDRLEAEGVVRDFEMKDRRFDGEIIWVRDSATVVRGDSGRVLWYEGSLEDITRWKEDGATARRGVVDLELLAEATREVVWRWDSTTGRVRWSDSLTEVFGYPSERPGPGIEQAYAWWRDRIHPADRERVVAAVHAAVRGGERGWMLEYRFRRLDGSYAAVLDRGCVAREAGGEPLGLLCSLLDTSAPPPPPIDGSTDVNAGPTDLDAPPVPPTSDETLVRWMTDRDQRAFRAFCERHRERVYRTALGMLDDEMDAEEISSTALLQVWRTAGSFDEDRGSAGAWLRSIVRARAIDRLRERQRRARKADRVATLEPGRPSGRRSRSRLDVLADRDLVRRGLHILPDAQRQAVQLAFLHELTHSEIAERLGLPLGTVKTRIRTGLRRLRSSLSASST